MMLILKRMDHVYLRHLSTECWSILSADMVTDTRLIYRPTLGRYVGRDSVACRSTWTDKHVGRHPADTSPPLGRHSAATRPLLGRHSAAIRPPLGCHSAATRPILYQHSATWSALATAGVLSSLLYWERLSVAAVLFWPLTPAIFMSFFQLCFFPRHRFYIRPSLLSDAAAFGNCCFWRLVILGEQKMI